MEGIVFIPVLSIWSFVCFLLFVLVSAPRADNLLCIVYDGMGRAPLLGPVRLIYIYICVCVFGAALYYSEGLPVMLWVA